MMHSLSTDRPWPYVATTRKNLFGSSPRALRDQEVGRTNKTEVKSDMTEITRPEAAAEGFQAAWNAHDMTALGALFHEDATFVNRFGHLVRGIDEIIALHAPIHQTIYRDSTLANEVIDVIAIGDGVAVLHFWSRLTVGSAHPAGPHSVDTLIQAVLTRHEGLWLIKALENVTLTNPRTGEPILRK
ncbi:YybH family protein [Pseudomonas citronellolis]|uniref:YybH family protein n=1 Tax=Pseudomonas citronellolis TaxID=53408 RepID=UPI0023E389E0|nr:SgcJ/EcaC family oxidoreductase [Pseudomonas citronellolis]MDF3933685.1 SgcJ/EcaC family oxidoreductase [Pseudomonas citronellolis]